MSDDQVKEAGGSEISDELKRAISENPEEIAGFIQRLELTNELLDVASLGTKVINDEMVTSLAGTASRVGELTDSATDPKTMAGIKKLLAAIRNAPEQEDMSRTPGLLGLMRELTDPDFRRGLEFLIGMTKELGRSLEG